MILIGSRALFAINPAILGRPMLDYDFISTEEEAKKFISKKCDNHKIYDQGKKIIAEGPTPFEFEILERSPTARMFKELVDAEQHSIACSAPWFESEWKCPSLNLLFTLKSSHRYLKNSPHFWKNAMDYHRMKICGAFVEDTHKDFLRTREKETYTYNHPKLNVKKKDFFKDDNIQYIYDHDSIHEAVKHLDKPAYRYYMKDGEEVQTSKSKFFEVDEIIRLYGVLEESYVLALERSQIPFEGIDPKKSFLMALSKVCTSITSGWFREFAYENIFSVLKMYNPNYVERFNSALEAGIVKSFESH